MKITRKDIEIVARHSNWKEDEIDQLLKREIYSDKATWQRFLRFFLISLGVGFTSAGVVFFFAYNWADLHKFAKFGLIQALLVSVFGLMMVFRAKPLVKNTLLTAIAVLVGVLFAVFGQIYQTGADAYDLFLVWVAAISLWVIVSNFAPLWLIFILLLNVTLNLYEQQMASEWTEMFLLTLHTLLNFIFLLACTYGNYLSDSIKAPIWLTRILALAVAFFSSTGIIEGVFREKTFEDSVTLIGLIIITLGFYGIGVSQSFRKKNVFYLALIAFCVIAIFASVILREFHEVEMFFLISLFIVGSVTLVIKQLISLQKKWKI